MSNAYYRPGDCYVDTSNPSAPVLWYCTGAGDKTSSTWAQITGGSGAQIGLFAITALSNGNTFTAAPIITQNVSGVLTVTLGGTLTIAKPNRFWTTVASELIDGATITYNTHTNDNYRLASDGTNTEYQVVFPRYLTMTQLSLSGASFTGSDAINLLTSQCVIKAAQITNGGSAYGITGSLGNIATWEEITPRVWARAYNQDISD